jgi:hypothetical protein
MRLPALLMLGLLLAGTSPPSHAEIMIGGYSSGATGTHPLRQFAANAQGPAAALREIAGPNTNLNSPGSVGYEPVENLLYVSDYFGQAIRVFPAFASGDVAPLRILNPPLLGQPRASVPIAALDELIVIAGNCCIYTFPLHASGSNVNRIRSINWGGGSSGITQLNNPGSLIWLPGSDEVAVVDYEFGTFEGKVVFHSRLTDGDAAPTRVLKSVHTANAAGLAHDPVQHKLYLLTSTTSDNVTYAGQIRVFADSASGTDAPLYTIEGPATQLAFDSPNYQSGLAIDGPLHRLMVGIAANGNSATNRVLGFDLDASGNAAPVQVLAGSNLSPETIGAPFAVPVDAIFANGFENP